VSRARVRLGRLARLAAPRPGTALTVAFLGGYLVLSLFPIFWIVVSSFKTRVDTLALPPVWLFRPTLDAYLRVFVFEYYYRYFFNTTVIALGTTVIALGLGSMAAYVIDRYPFRFSHLIAYALLGTRMIFPIVYAIPLFLLFRDVDLLDTHLGLVIAYSTFSLPYAVWIMSGFFAAVPTEIDEAAMVDGCSRFGAFCRVILPLTAPIRRRRPSSSSPARLERVPLRPDPYRRRPGEDAPVAAQLIGQRRSRNELCAVPTATIVPCWSSALVHKYLVRMIAGAVK
jgi:ABC-type glycerol-3-phosphate transport system permease component